MPAPKIGFDRATGVAAVELNACGISPALEASLHLVLKFGTALRAITIRIVGSSALGRRLGASERVGGALDALQALGVPIVCSADGKVGGDCMAVWWTANYRISSEGTDMQAHRDGSISEWAARPRERVVQFVAWLAHHVPFHGQV